MNAAGASRGRLLRRDHARRARSRSVLPSSARPGWSGSRYQPGASPAGGAGSSGSGSGPGAAAARDPGPAAGAGPGAAAGSSSRSGAGGDRGASLGGASCAARLGGAAESRDRPSSRIARKQQGAESEPEHAHHAAQSQPRDGQRHGDRRLVGADPPNPPTRLRRHRRLRAGARRSASDPVPRCSTGRSRRHEHTHHDGARRVVGSPHTTAAAYLAEHWALDNEQSVKARAGGVPASSGHAKGIVGDRVAAEIHRSFVSDARLKADGCPPTKRGMLLRALPLALALLLAVALNGCASTPTAGGSAQSSAAGECHPNYAGACLDPDSPDYDCAGGRGNGPDYTGPVQSIGGDPYGLDADGDGSACEG